MEIKVSRNSLLYKKHDQFGLQQIIKINIVQIQLQTNTGYQKMVIDTKFNKHNLRYQNMVYYNYIMNLVTRKHVLWGFHQARQKQASAIETGLSFEISENSNTYDGSEQQRCRSDCAGAQTDLCYYCLSHRHNTDFLVPRHVWLMLEGRCTTSRPSLNRRLGIRKYIFNLD